MQGLLQPVISLQPQEQQISMTEGVTEIPAGRETVTILPASLSVPDMPVVAVPEATPFAPSAMSVLPPDAIDITGRGASAELTDRIASDIQSNQSVQIVSADLMNSLSAVGTGANNILVQTPDGNIMQIPAQVLMQTLAMQNLRTGGADSSQAQKAEDSSNTVSNSAVVLSSGASNIFTGATSSIHADTAIVPSSTLFETMPAVPQILVVNNSMMAADPGPQNVDPGILDHYSQPGTNNQAPSEPLTSVICNSDQSATAYVCPVPAVSETATSASSIHIGIDKSVGEVISTQSAAHTPVTAASAMSESLTASLLAPISSLKSTSPVSVPNRNIPASTPTIPKDGTLTSAIASGIPVSIMPGASPESVVLNQLFVPVYNNTEKGPIIELVPVKPSS